MHILRWFLALFIGVGAVLCGGSIEDQFSQWENIVRITVGRMDANTGIVTFTICGGSLISSLLVLTSADCTSQSSVPDIKLKSSFAKIQRYMSLSGHPTEFNNNAELRCLIVEVQFDSQSMTYKFGFNDGNVSLCPETNLPSDLGVDNEELWIQFLCIKKVENWKNLTQSGSPVICDYSQYGIIGSTTTGGILDQNKCLFIYNYVQWISKINKTVTDISGKSSIIRPKNLITLMQLVHVVLFNRVFILSVQMYLLN